MKRVEDRAGAYEALMRRHHTVGDLWDAMDLLAHEFGFIDYGQFADWHDRNPQVSLEAVRGPNALIILKALIAKYDLRQH